MRRKFEGSLVGSFEGSFGQISTIRKEGKEVCNTSLTSLLNDKEVYENIFR